MGVPGLWDILRPAGEVRSLTHLAVVDGFEANPAGARGFRVGIDASIWFFHATYGREGENPELRTLFFRCSRLMSMPFLPLFVFDGPKRPEFKRGKRVSGKNNWMEQGMQEIIHAFGFEWRKAPGEAEAELAYLNKIGVIDAVLSDDVDTFLFGATMVVRKDDGNHVATYKSSVLAKHSSIRLTQGGMILFGILCGGDYHQAGLMGCGATTAHGLAKCGFGDSLLEAARNLPRDVLPEFLATWREDLRQELRTNSKGHLGRKMPSLAKKIPEDFPNVEVLLSYTNPVTSESRGKTAKDFSIDWEKEPDLGRVAGLCEMYFEWGIREIIIKRFRTVLWPSAVLRILRRSVLLADKKASRASAGLPSTPRKNPKDRLITVRTPSKMIAKHFSQLELGTPRARSWSAESDTDAEETEEPLVVKIHSTRTHASTGGVLEYRLEIAPAQLVRICEAGVRGLRTALPADLSDSAEEDEDEDGPRPKGKGKKPPPDPMSHLRVWLPACMVRLAEPELVDNFEAVQAMKQAKKAAKARKLAPLQLVRTRSKPPAAPAMDRKAGTRRRVLDYDPNDIIDLT
ncbi:PIN domain-like protein [Obba rivulosa]|uniref:PIN domain-like protein n=1 Tax=Obba rivulosa TaxID=1052685 RepID=A0A8E2B065_9APHY|nr:PIN domain-like protein [Obba rivulosa]